ncbi:maleylpyruvate isomerase N-terminal domain-containing protein [Streptomyces sp. NPDC008343]|uniref:maleylpyruvate isomerase N-terminal domain-containing protein n=1 Tax=Streptomyces sp. NPDC008343 TaxID=3364828 RepID=UPI0036E40E68
MAASRSGTPLLGRHHRRRRACRRSPGRVRFASRPGCASGARRPAGLAGRIDATAAGRTREAGPDRGCLTWWGTSQSPQTCGAVARHQLQEVALHTYDAQLTVGAPLPLPDEAALDGVDEFLSTSCAGTAAWPHEPTVVDYHATEGHSWRLTLSADGARVTRLHTPAAADGAAGAAGASARGTAGELASPCTAVFRWSR